MKAGILKPEHINDSKGKQEMLEAGIKGIKEIQVSDKLTAAAVDPALPPVYATPNLVSLIETTAAASVAPYLGEDQTTVGTVVNIRHMAATPVGMTVRCETTLTEVDRKRLEFEIRAYDDKELVAEGTHQRFIIGLEKFLVNVEKKKQA